MKSTHSEKIRLAGIKKHGSEKAWRAFCRDSAKKVRNRGNGGFAAMKQTNPDKLHAIAYAGGKARWQKGENIELNKIPDAL